MKLSIPKSNYSVKHVIQLSDLPVEILAHCFLSLRRTARIKASQSCWLFSDIIHHHVGYIALRIKSRASVKRLKASPLLQNTQIDLSTFSEATDDDLSYLSGVRHLRLWNNTNITDNGLKHVSTVDTVTMRCYQITDKGMKFISGASQICLYNAKGITNNGFKLLKGTTIIGLFNSHITDDALKCLAGVHTIKLGRCKNITNDGLKALAGVHKICVANTNITDEGVLALLSNGNTVYDIDLRNCHVSGRSIKQLGKAHKIDISGTNVTDDGLRGLVNVHTLILRSCYNITLRGISALKNVHTIDIRETNAEDSWLFALSHVNKIKLSGTKITNAGLRGLSKVKHVCMRKCEQITDSGVKHLVNVETLDVSWCPKVTKDFIEHLPCLKILTCYDTAISLPGTNSTSLTILPEHRC